MPYPINRPIFHGPLYGTVLLVNNRCRHRTQRPLADYGERRGRNRFAVRLPRTPRILKLSKDSGLWVRKTAAALCNNYIGGSHFRIPRSSGEHVWISEAPKNLFGPFSFKKGQSHAVR
ncbi:hypothetical protein [Rikenella microfusus]|uniref:hypothetical protein n=1 Tax=Rikenella microfusus TaxID=28139 RepID=UPI0023555484|nr:hypothetical protein [Rikenella microfusus]